MRKKVHSKHTKRRNAALYKQFKCMDMDRAEGSFPVRQLEKAPPEAVFLAENRVNPFLVEFLSCDGRRVNDDFSHKLLTWKPRGKAEC